MSSPGRRTMAQQHCDKIRSNRKKWFDDLLRNIQESEAVNLEKQLVESNDWWRQQNMGDDLVQALIDEIAKGVRNSFVELGYLRSLLDKACFVATIEDTVVAHQKKFEDGTGAIVVSDGLIGLASTYTRLLLHNMEDAFLGSRVTKTLKALLLARSRRQNIELYSCLLRYYNVQQRVFGLAGKLTLTVEPHVERFFDLINSVAQHFILAHECAHFVLDHPDDVHDLNETVTGPVNAAQLADSQHFEMEADDLAMAATLKLIAKDSRLPALYPILGALTAIWAIELDERALFVRSGDTHPPADLRIGRVVRHLEKRHAGALGILARPLFEATNRASDFTMKLERGHWGATFSNPRVTLEPHKPAYLQHIVHLDDFQCMTAVQAQQLLREDFPGVQTAMRSGVDLIVDGKIDRGLHAWGLPAREIEYICDVGQPLTYFQLQQDIFDAIDDGTGRNTNSRRAASVLAATLVSRKLPGA